MNALSSGNLKRDYARFCIPCVMNMLVFSLFSTVDGLFVGRYIGSDALACVSLSMPYMSILFCIGITLAVGSGTLIAKSLGEGNIQKADAIFSQNIVVAVLLGVLLSGITAVLLNPICRLLGADETTLAGTASYVGTISLFATCVILEYNLEFLVKTDGNPRLSVGTVISTCLLNVFLDWFFIAKLSMGIFGAALATGISQCIASLVFFFYILCSKNGLFHFRRFHPDLKLYKELIPIGFSDGSLEICTAILVWVFNLVMRQLFQTDGVAVCSLLIYSIGLSLNLYVGFSQGMEPLVSFHYGASDTKSHQTVFRYALLSQGLVAIGIFVGLEILAPVIAQLFLKDAAAAAYGLAVSCIRWFAPAVLLSGFNILTAGYLTALCRPRQALVLSILRSLVIQVIFFLLFAWIFRGTTMWIGCFVSEVLVAVYGLKQLKKVK